MAASIRIAREGDAEQILSIYAPFVRDTAVSFELEPPPPAEMSERIAATLSGYPWLVCEQRGTVLGYAYAGRHRKRAAYDWSVETSVYVRPDARRVGVGRGLYGSLFAILVLQGYYTAYAGIALPNPASVGLHEALGFLPIGVYRQVGYKLGKWHDVGWWQLSLQSKPEVPGPPLSLPEARSSPRWEEAIESGESFIRLFYD